VIAVLDYGIGNLRSAEKALQHVGGDARLVTNATDAIGAQGIVLPGVGAFGACASALRASGLDAVAYSAIEAGVPFLGVCVGFQLLFEGSEESPDVPGLGIFSGTVRRLSGQEKLPQMQWNLVQPVDRLLAMFGNSKNPAWFYFVHSYAPVPEGDAISAVAGTCDYGGPVIAAIEQGTCWGTQFHPEKSGPTGLSLLGSFVAMCDQSSVVMSGVPT
jgi:glutamine amidotransferase